MPVTYDVIYGSRRKFVKRKEYQLCFSVLDHASSRITRSPIKQVDYWPSKFLRNNTMAHASKDICNWAKGIVPEIEPYYKWLRYGRARGKEAPPVTVDATKRSGAYMIAAFSYARLGQVFAHSAVPYSLYIILRDEYGLSVPRALAFSTVFENCFSRNTPRMYSVKPWPADYFAEIYDPNMPRNLNKIQEREYNLTQGGLVNTYSATGKYTMSGPLRGIGPDYMFTGHPWTLAGTGLRRRTAVQKALCNGLSAVRRHDRTWGRVYTYLGSTSMKELVENEALFCFD